MAVVQDNGPPIIKPSRLDFEFNNIWTFPTDNCKEVAFYEDDACDEVDGVPNVDLVDGLHKYARCFLELGPKELDGTEIIGKLALNEDSIVLQNITDHITRTAERSEGTLTKLSLCQRCHGKNHCGIMAKVTNLDEWKQVPSYCTQSKDFSKVSEQLYADNKIQCAPGFQLEIPTERSKITRMLYLLIHPNTRIKLDHWDSVRKWLYRAPDRSRFITKPGLQDALPSNCVRLRLLDIQCVSRANPFINLQELNVPGGFLINHIHHFYCYVIDILPKKDEMSQWNFEAMIHHKPIHVPEFTFVLTHGIYRDLEFATTIQQIRLRCNEEDTQRSETLVDKNVKDVLPNESAPKKQPFVSSDIPADENCEG